MPRGHGEIGYFRTTSCNCCRLAKQDNVVQGSHSKLALPVVCAFNLQAAWSDVSQMYSLDMFRSFISTLNDEQN